MYCKVCGSEMNENQAICLKCGVETGKGNSYCANCGKPIATEAIVCLNCGVAVKTDEKKKNENYLNGQDRMVIALVCFFLGGIGIHNFVLGEKKKGIFKIVGIFLCGISGILALIDFVKILMGSYVVDPEKLI